MVDFQIYLTTAFICFSWIFTEAIQVEYLCSRVHQQCPTWEPNLQPQVQFHMPYTVQTDFKEIRIPVSSKELSIACLLPQDFLSGMKSNFIQCTTCQFQLQMERNLSPKLSSSHNSGLEKGLGEKACWLGSSLNLVPQVIRDDTWVSPPWIA